MFPPSLSYPSGSLTTWQSTGVKAATPVGNLFGQLIFGWLADIVGRKRMCMSSSSVPLCPLVSPTS